jgi:hypothetical protein
LSSLLSLLESELRPRRFAGGFWFRCRLGSGCRRGFGGWFRYVFGFGLGYVFLAWSGRGFSGRFGVGRDRSVMLP